MMILMMNMMIVMVIMNIYFYRATFNISLRFLRGTFWGYIRGGRENASFCNSLIQYIHVVHNPKILQHKRNLLIKGPFGSYDQQGPIRGMILKVVPL